MDPGTLVAQALAAGVGAGLSGAASSAVTECYAALKQALVRRLAARPGALERIELLERRPGGSAEGLAHDLVLAGAVDAEVVEHARRLLALTAPDAGPRGTYRVDLREARGVQVGDGNTQHNTFG
ncbi:hypothetical protein [Streptomyces griseorubiginosus]|uniref:hypothetical protein n=1 Tax=Streptomyces griseorubiginosus TaxID=67304 RepID=UPI001AD70441|nr:hypothetical protein [Streptomyces griseorubiginosus]MBO4255006.1 hypothetical protein [Streptomyces griseorubiginosus]